MHSLHNHAINPPCSELTRRGAGRSLNRKRPSRLLICRRASLFFRPRLSPRPGKNDFRTQEHAEHRREHIAELNKRAAETDLRLKRLYDAIEGGVADVNDPAVKGASRASRRPTTGRKPTPIEPLRCWSRQVSRRSRHRWSGGSPGRRESASGSTAGAIAATISARSRSGSRSRTARSASSARKAICSRP
jgi:hypothetical protein